MLDDLLIGDAGLVPLGRGAPTHALMGRFGNVLLVNGEPRLSPDGQAGRGRALLPHQRRQHAHVQPLVSRRADEGRRVRRRAVRARGVGRERGDRAGGAIRRGRAVRPAGHGGAGQPGARARPPLRPVLRRDRHARHGGRWRRQPIANDLGARLRDAARDTTPSAARSSATARARTRAPEKTLVLTLETHEPAARHPAADAARLDLLRAGRVERHDADDELGLHRPAGALDPARPDDRQGEHGHRLAFRRGEPVQDPARERAAERSMPCSTRSISTASASWCWR